MAGCLAIRVAGAVRGDGGDRAGRRHPLCGVPPFVEVFDAASTAMAQAALGGFLPLAGHRAAVTLMCTALHDSGCAGGFGLSSFFLCESSLFRINQRYHGLGTRLWHTPPAFFSLRRVRDEGATSSGGDNYVRASRATGVPLCESVRRLSPGAGVRTAATDG